MPVLDMRRNRHTVATESDSSKEETERLTLDKSDVMGCARAVKHKQKITQSCVGGCIHVGISYKMTDMLEQGLQQTKTY